MNVLRILSAVSLACASLVAAAVARAEMPRTMRLEVNGADTCPGGERVREAIAVAAGVDPIDPKASARLVVTLVSGGELARGRWELHGPDGTKLRERTATVSGSCSQVVAELALSFAVAWETDAAAPCCDDACKAKAREEARRQLIAEGYVSRMDVHAVVMAGGLVSANLTADPGGGFFLAGEAAGEVFRGALEVRVLFPSRAVAEPTNFNFELTAVTAALVPCARWKVLLGCAVFDIGMLIAGGTAGPPMSGPPVIATLGIGPRLGVHVPFAERFAVRAFADLRFSPVPSTYNFIDTGARWESQVVSGLFGVGLSFE